ncbi:Hypothetical protein CINCED_3A005172 [Cinara cedri]|uniref:Uncharacterized protein n=1 Tax=Cinara cedri TaxID=506608 RepID=A0A5E4MW55_9HEMI|nr:Hypothetical protein CINCED_3A005172 [Cinara cedri]
MEERNAFYEKLDEYYKFKSTKKPFTKCAQLQMISKIEMAIIKTQWKKHRRQYYLLSTYDVLSIAEEKFLIHKQNAADEKIRETKKELTILKLISALNSENRKLTGDLQMIMTMLIVM